VGEGREVEERMKREEKRGERRRKEEKGPSRLG
jgi:hypothetical protein